MSGTTAVPAVTQTSGLARLVAATTLMAEVTARPAASHDDVMHGLCRAAALAVRVDGVGAMLSDGTALRFVHADPPWVASVERLQEVHGRGPCWDSVTAGRLVAVDDVRSCLQWPELAARAGHRPGGRPAFRGVASLPLIGHQRPFGVLDLYRTATDPWTPDELSAAGACAQVAATQLALVSERERWQAAWAQAEHRSTHDELTGLPARGVLFDRLEHALATMTRRGSAVAVLFLDIDGFKRVNDEHGHAVGDAALVEIAHRLGATLRANDTLARLSGDEFVIVCEDLPGTVGAIHEWLHRLGERILLELRRPAAGQETAVDVSVSIGAALATSPCSARHLTSQADQAMYTAKRSGGGRLVLHRTPTHP